MFRSLFLYFLSSFFLITQVYAQSTYSQEEINSEVQGFFSSTAKGLGDVLAKIFNEYGQPTGYIKGSEGGGALFVGFKYGEGNLYLKSGLIQKLYWQGPSLGFDAGGDAAKVFTLVYGLVDPEKIFQRFPGVSGSAYVVGGFGVNYQKSGNITLAPIRAGVGLRLGANLGYTCYTKEKTINPF